MGLWFWFKDDGSHMAVTFLLVASWGSIEHHVVRDRESKGDLPSLLLEWMTH